MPSAPPAPALPCLPACPQKNHLSGIQRKLLKLSFWNQENLMQVRWVGEWVGGWADSTDLPCPPRPACLAGCLSASVPLSSPE